MSEATKVQGGRTPDDIVERIAGGLGHRAITFVELASALYAAREEFVYDDQPEAAELVEMCDRLASWLDGMSMLPDGQLSSWRECARCSGAGATSGEDPCVECAGVGATSRGETAA